MDKKSFDEVDYNGVSYTNLDRLIYVFENNEYDSLEKAASELIDNSIDANAKDIIVYLKNGYSSKVGKEVLEEIAFLDNGEGMSPGRLQHIVGFGASNRNEGGSIGKFGIGLNQASLYACDRFIVYSWQNEDEVYKEVFDKEYIINNKIEKAPVPEKTMLPQYITGNHLFKSKFKSHGSLIVWQNLKRNKIKKTVTVENNMKLEFGRIYRRYLNDKRLTITLYKDEAISNVEAIDPMFLMQNVEALGNCNGSSILSKNGIGEPLFKPFESELLDENGCKYYDIPYYDDNDEIKESRICLRVSIIKEKFYYKAAIKDGFKQPGDTEIGKYVKKYEKGISIIRNEREIDFKRFDFYDNTNQPADRWFKLEIQFTDELDKVFNVTNNKQHVELKKINENKYTEYKTYDPDYPLWLRLKDDIKKLIAELRKQNKAIASYAKNKKDYIYENLDEEKVTVEVTESLESILNSGKLHEDESKIDNNLVINENINLSSESSKTAIEEIIITSKEDGLLSKRNELQANADNNDYYKMNHIKILYDETINNWIDYKYDFTEKHYLIKFNLQKIDYENFDSKLEKFIVLLVYRIINDSYTDSNEFKSLLDDYYNELAGE